MTDSRASSNAPPAQRRREKRNVDGWVVLDDYGYWQGCREALQDFLHERRLAAPQLLRCGYTQVQAVAIIWALALGIGLLSLFLQ